MGDYDLSALVREGVMKVMRVMAQTGEFLLTDPELLLTNYIPAMNSMW